MQWNAVDETGPFPPPFGPTFQSDEVLMCTAQGTYLLGQYDFKQSCWVYKNGKKTPHTVVVKWWANIPEPEGGRFQHETV